MGATAWLQVGATILSAAMFTPQFVLLRLSYQHDPLIARKCLSLARSEVWRYGRHELTILLRLPDGELAVEEA